MREQLLAENNMLFDRAAKRLVEIYELRAELVVLRKQLATAYPVEVQPPQRVLEQIAIVMEGEYSADELRFVVYNDTTAYEWLLPELETT